jgi:hypothetical protein
MRRTLDAEDAARQLSGLPYRHEAGAELNGQGGGEEESSSLDPGDPIDTGCRPGGREGADHRRKQFAIGQDGSDVLEYDTGFREIRHVTNGGPHPGDQLIGEGATHHLRPGSRRGGR